mgnify:CR=1 FL=1
MRFLLIIFFLLVGCSKPKPVLICGDHKCINKAEADQYFKEFLNSLEIFFRDLEKAPNCFKRFGISFGPITITTIINISANSDNPKESIIIYLRQPFSLYHLFFLHHSYHV